MSGVWVGVVAGVWLTAAPTPARPPRQSPAATSTPAPRKALVLEADPARAVAQVRALYDALAYEEVIDAADALLQREGLPLEIQLEGYRLLGSARAVVQDALEAEGPFRLLLRAKPDYELPADTSPKILAAFRKVQVEEKRLAEKLARVQRQRTIASIELLGELPARARGGSPLHFEFRVKDPTGEVDAVDVPYRRRGAGTYSVLSLDRQKDGRWMGALAGEVTSSDAPYALELAVETRDEAGVLATLGSRAEPRLIEVAAGRPRSRPPSPPWLFLSALGLTATAGAGAGGLGAGLAVTQAEYRRAAVVDGAEASSVKAIAVRGETLATATTAALITTGATAVITLVLLPLTNWGDPDAAER